MAEALTDTWRRMSVIRVCLDRSASLDEPLSNILYCGCEVKVLQMESVMRQVPGTFSLNVGGPFSRVVLSLGLCREPPELGISPRSYSETA